MTQTARRCFFAESGWEAWPPVRHSREEAIKDGEVAREREIERLMRRIEFVRTAPIPITEYDISEDVANG